MSGLEALLWVPAFLCWPLTVVWLLLNLFLMRVCLGLCWAADGRVRRWVRWEAIALGPRDFILSVL